MSPIVIAETASITSKPGVACVWLEGGEGTAEAVVEGGTEGVSDISVVPGEVCAGKLVVGRGVAGVCVAVVVFVISGFWPWLSRVTFLLIVFPVAP